LINVYPLGEICRVGTWFKARCTIRIGLHKSALTDPMGLFQFRRARYATGQHALAKSLTPSVTISVGLLTD
jgi:hypothetical protein